MSEREWPDEINGWPARPQHGACPGCHAPEDRWCEPDCKHLDPMDYR